MRRTIAAAAALAVLAAAMPTASVAQTTTATTADPQDAKRHELECMAGTVGGAVIGVALGSFFGGGLGKAMFEAGGAAVGIDRGRSLKCGSKS